MARENTWGPPALGVGDSSVSSWLVSPKNVTTGPGAAVGLTVGDGVEVQVGVVVRVGVGEGRVGVGVADEACVNEGVGVAGMRLGVAVGVPEGVALGLRVGVGVGVCVGVRVGVRVGVGVREAVGGTGVGVDVGVNVGGIGPGPICSSICWRELIFPAVSRNCTVSSVSSRGNARLAETVKQNCTSVLLPMKS